MVFSVAEVFETSPTVFILLATVYASDESAIWEKIAWQQEGKTEMLCILVQFCTLSM